MNTLTEHDRKLAEALKYLSLEPQAETPKSRRTAIRWIVGVVLVSAIPVITILVAGSSTNDIKIPLLGPAKPGQLDQTALAKPLHVIADQDTVSAFETSAVATREITGSGYVVAPRSTTVFSKYEGKITRIDVDVGTLVHAGQTLVILEDTSASIALEQANAAKISTDLTLTAREIALAQATASLHRIDTLAQRGATSKSQFEQAETAWKSALNQVEQSRQDVVKASLAIRFVQEHVDELAVRAPFTATVVQLNAHVGDTVLDRADSVRESQSLLTLTDTTGMVIDADVAETNASVLEPGLHGEAVLDGFPDQPFNVQVQRIAPIASAEKGTVGLRLSLINPPVGIRPNMAARVRIIIPKTQKPNGETQP